MRYTLVLTSSLFPLPSSLFPLPSSLFPLPSSLFPLPSSLLRSRSVAYGLSPCSEVPKNQKFVPHK
ncbi:hypothetical protein [Moorena sp. SIO4G3]|uniref:hypothetical protein n=1 Tax=Moorena sp. SIO4G3 TaxID=2607821 RepID=UPI001429EF5C|nr:hypothetical protein [Moorena sp. SIO4G3]NEO75840.1 hypothetical protein [Moorena sp. SIO4G3]